MAKSCKDTLTRKYEIKDLFFADDHLMMSVKDSSPEEIDLMRDLKAFFGDNVFNLTVNMKTESLVEEPDDEIDIDELSPDENDE